MYLARHASADTAVSVLDVVVVSRPEQMQVLLDMQASQKRASLQRRRGRREVLQDIQAVSQHRSKRQRPRADSVNFAVCRHPYLSNAYLFSDRLFFLDALRLMWPFESRPQGDDARSVLLQPVPEGRVSHHVSSGQGYSTGESVFSAG